jgi:hypothetical protein
MRRTSIPFLQEYINTVWYKTGGAGIWRKLQ